MAGNLYIKWTSADTGARPIPGGSSWWLSPSIWINSSGNAQASSGKDNLIYVQPDRIVFETRGAVEGRVAPAPKGTDGFGYEMSEAVVVTDTGVERLTNLPQELTVWR